MNNYAKIFLVMLCIFIWQWMNREISYDHYEGHKELELLMKGSEIIGHVELIKNSRTFYAGHGFVLQHDKGPFVVTASHTFSGNITAIKRINVRAGEEILVADAEPALGPAYSTCSMMDAGNDVGFFKTSYIYAHKGFLLSSEPAKTGQNVWLYCTHDKLGEESVLIPATVTASSNKALRYDFARGINFQGTSGCPILNAKKQLVAVNVCGNGKNAVGVPLVTIKNGLGKIKENQ